MMCPRSCDICKKAIKSPSPYSAELCASCGIEFLEVIRAIGELTIEMANAHGVNLLQQDAIRALPGIPIGEIEIRKELNQLKRKHPLL